MWCPYEILMSRSWWTSSAKERPNRPGGYLQRSVLSYVALCVDKFVRALYYITEIIQCHPHQHHTYVSFMATYEMLIMCGQQHSFLTHKRMFLWKCRRFKDRKCIKLRRARTPNLRIHAKWSNHLSYQGQTFAVPCNWMMALVVIINKFIKYYPHQQHPLTWH